MKPKDYPESFKVVLGEMCSRVGAKYEDIDFSKPKWYMEYSWDAETQTSFIDWMTDYLYKTSQARNEILNNPIKNKKHIRKAVSEFVFNYGWRESV